MSPLLEKNPSIKNPRFASGLGSSEKSKHYVVAAYFVRGLQNQVKLYDSSLKVRFKCLLNPLHMQLSVHVVDHNMDKLTSCSELVTTLLQELNYSM